MSKVKYAIPSHRRSEIIAKKTLDMLAQNGVKPEDVTIFVSDDEDARAYQPLVKYGYNLVTPFAHPAGMIEKFNYIHDHYEIGDRVVFVEDDLDMLKAKGDGKNELRLFTDLPALAEHMFSMCDARGTKLWGISSNANPFFMKKDHYSYGFKFVVANLFGFVVTRDSFLKISQHMKSDYERTLLYFVKFGGICRADGVCAVTRNYRTPGGLQELGNARRAELERSACEHLVKRFPHLVEINEIKSEKSMYMELRFKTQKKNTLVDWMGLQQQIDKELSCSNSPATPAT